MRTRSVVVVSVVILVMAGCSGVQPLTESRSEQITFESVDLPGRLWDPFMPPLSDGSPVTVGGLLTLPATDRPVPGVIISHGCGGVGAAEMGWTHDLEVEGIATFVVDSFQGRGISSVCAGEETINVFSPVIDVYRAAEVLDDHPYVDGSRLAVMGFSFGGRAAIWSGFTRFQEAYGGRRFVGHIAFYPSTCFIELSEADMDGVPLRIFHGVEDDWTPIDQCREMVDRLVSEGEDATLFAYPDAGHSFDNASLAWSVSHFSPSGVSPRDCSFIERDGEILDRDTGKVAGVGSPCVERGVSYAYTQAARDAAAADLIAELETILELKPTG